MINKYLKQAEAAVGCGCFSYLTLRLLSIPEAASWDAKSVGQRPQHTEATKVQRTCLSAILQGVELTFQLLSDLYRTLKMQQTCHLFPG